MTAERKTVPGWMVVAAAAVAGILAGGIGVYVRLSADSNAPGAAPAAIAVNCDAAVARAKRLAPLARGDLAAFAPTDKSESFAGLSFKDADGKDTTLAAFGGRVLLVNLWATWCVPCRAEMPALDKLEAAKGGDGFAVVPINLDVKGPEAAKAFLEKIGVTRLPLYSDPAMGVFNDLKRRGLALGLPTSLLVDGKGCRLGVVEGPAAWDSADAAALIDAARAG
jgi:thiol-disulfide isomerase/thioredoxin